jgi:hypothetical protein
MKMRCVLLPEITIPGAAEPSMVICFVTTSAELPMDVSSDEVSAIVCPASAGAKATVSPDAAEATDVRSDPAPLSLALVTVIVAALACRAIPIITAPMNIDRPAFFKIVDSVINPHRCAVLS